MRSARRSPDHAEPHAGRPVDAHLAGPARRALRHRLAARRRRPRAGACTAVDRGRQLVPGRRRPGLVGAASTSRTCRPPRSRPCCSRTSTPTTSATSARPSRRAGSPAAREPLDVYGPPGIARVVDGFAAGLRAGRRRTASRTTATTCCRAAAAPRWRTRSRCRRARTPTPWSCSSATACASRCSASTTRPVVAGRRLPLRLRAAARSSCRATRARARASSRTRTGADMLVHEALAARSCAARAPRSRDRLGHDAPREARRATSRATTRPRSRRRRSRATRACKHLVLTHLVPGPPNRARAAHLPRRHRRMSIPGEITLGEDGMRFQLAARSQ